MARNGLYDAFHHEFDSYTSVDTLLPPFPKRERVLKAFPGLTMTGLGSGKALFLHWVDFALEHPDEIWESESSQDIRFYYYLSFLDREGHVPAIAVEVGSLEEYVEVNNYSLLLEESQLEQIRCGLPVYNLLREWERDTLVRSLNDEALRKYDEADLEQARTLIDKAIAVSGRGFAYLFNNRGLIAWKMGKIDQARQDFLESIKLDPANGDPYFNMGLISFDQADFDQALHFLSRAVEIDPSDSQFLTELGHLYLELKREKEALMLFERAFKSNPNDARVDFHLGHYFLYKKASPRKAIKHYLRGLAKDPDDQLALADLAVAHWEIGQGVDSWVIVESLQESPQLLPYTVSRLVYLNAEMGYYDAALKYYQHAFTLSDPFEPEWLHYNAALVYAKTGRPDLALDTLEAAVKVGGEAVIERAMTDKALKNLRGIPDFHMRMETPGKRHNR
ncbi:tetratricopeptide repeat protein [Thermodesulfobacteriota bacterium]